MTTEERTATGETGATPSPASSVKIAAAKGRPMLSWVGKRPLREVRAFPAQLVERFSADGTANPEVDWSAWPDRYERGGLLFHGDNKEVLAHLLANGFRGKLDLVYIDPPFDSGADYVRRVQLRGASGTARLDGETYTLGEQIQYTDIWANDTYLQFMYERLLLLKELLSPTGSIYLHCDAARGHQLRYLLDEVMGSENFVNEIIWSYRRWTAPSHNFQELHDTIYWYAKDKTRRLYNTIWVTPANVEKGVAEGYEQDGDGRLFRWQSLRGERYKIYRDERGVHAGDVWDISFVHPSGGERTAYPTQKPEALLDRIVKASSNPGDIVLDCFIGSGTTAAVAQKLGDGSAPTSTRAPSRPPSSAWRA